MPSKLQYHCCSGSVTAYVAVEGPEETATCMMKSHELQQAPHFPFCCAALLLGKFT